MKVLNICADDWANLMHVHSNALRSVGVECLDMKFRPHAFGYESESQIAKPSDMVDAIKRADVVNIYHSSRTIANLIQATRTKAKSTVWHTGSDYRSEPDNVRNLFKSIGIVAEFTDQCEFLFIDPKLHYVATAIDIQAMRKYHLNSGMTEEIGRRFSVAHYPSKSDVKGSETINRMMSAHSDKFIYHYSDEKVSHDKQLRRMANCHIYIELFQPELNGKPYGCFGVTAFEAAALGKVVITQNINEAAYANVYGGCPLVIANNEDQFNKALDSLSTYGALKLQRHQVDTFRWVLNNHSYEATGQRIKKLLSGLF